MTIYEAAFHFQNGDDDYFNVVHYDVTGDEPLDLQDLTDEIVASWVTNLAPIIVPSMNFLGIVWRLDVPGSVSVEITPTGGAENGSNVVQSWVGQMAVLVRKSTGGTVRPTLGRAFVPGVNSQGFGSNGNWTAGILTACESFWDDIIIVPFAGNGQAEMLLKASNPTAPNTNPYNSVTECTALANPSALQSRKKGRGA